MSTYLKGAFSYLPPREVTGVVFREQTATISSLFLIGNYINNISTRWSAYENYDIQRLTEDEHCKALQSYYCTSVCRVTIEGALDTKYE